MEIIQSLQKPIVVQKPVVLTIGNFDGMHLGHQAVFNSAKELSRAQGCPCAVLTFENHPADILRPGQSVPMLCTLPHKILLLEKSGSDLLILLPFTKELSQMTAEEFLQKVYSCLPFAHLVLGHDATLGKDRQGNRPQIQAFAKRLGFAVEYIEPFSFRGQLVSSSVIRNLIQQGNLSLAAELLGRRYSIYAAVITGNGKGKSLGFATVNLKVDGLCLPPFGVYAVKVKHHDDIYNGVANIGFAPTVRTENQLLLEAHLFGCQKNLYYESVEVVFHQFIRPEKKFSSIPLLQDQIKHDTEIAKQILS